MISNRVKIRTDGKIYHFLVEFEDYKYLYTGSFSDDDGYLVAAQAVKEHPAWLHDMWTSLCSQIGVSSPVELCSASGLWRSNFSWDDLRAALGMETVSETEAPKDPPFEIFVSREASVREVVRAWRIENKLMSWPLHCGKPVEITEKRQNSGDTYVKLTCQYKDCLHAVTKSEIQNYFPKERKLP